MAGYVPWYGKKRAALVRREGDLLRLLEQDAPSDRLSRAAEEVRASWIRLLKAESSRIDRGDGTHAERLSRLDHPMRSWGARAVKEIVSEYRDRPEPDPGGESMRGVSMATIQADSLPIREAADGTLRVGESRVLVELVLRAFEDGAMPEEIVLRYSSLHLPDVYSIIGHYLSHRGEWAEYLAGREREAERIRSEITSSQRDLGEIRRRLLSARSEVTDAPPGGR